MPDLTNRTQGNPDVRRPSPTTPKLRPRVEKPKTKKPKTKKPKAKKPKKSQISTGGKAPRIGPQIATGRGHASGDHAQSTGTKEEERNGKGEERKEEERKEK
jgi:hypothetical protein